MRQRLNAMGEAPMPTPGSIAETARGMSAEAQAAGVPFLDLLAAFEANQAWRHSLLQTDGLHPSSAGHDLIAAEIQRWAAWRQLFPARQ
jgi:lysophospholipase L1-like esterase